MKNRLSAAIPRSARFASMAAAALFGGLLTACFQDPGQTGLGYLNEQGVRLSAPLYHFTFEDLPVDTAFATEIPLDHFGDTGVVVGRSERFTATTRLGFQITATSQLRHIDSGLFLRLVPLRPLTGIVGKNFLYESTRNRDSLTLLVESFVWVDTAGSFKDTLNHYHTRLLRSRLPFSTLNGAHRILDTIRISPKAAYDTVNQDTAEVDSLPNLRSRLAAGDSTDKWIIFQEISPLAGAADTGMFRFTSRVNSATPNRKYGSGLWLGHFREDSVSTTGLIAMPYATSGGQAGANYEIKHTGASTQSLLFGVSRGVHIRLNRDTLITRIKAALGADSGLIANNPSTGEFDRRFFVPYAEMRIPLRDSLNRVDGPFAFDVQVASDIDSLADGDVRGSVGVLLDSRIALPVTGNTTSGSSGKDTLRVSYRAYPVDTTLRQIILGWDKDADAVDTFLVAADGKARELTSRRHVGWQKATILNVTPFSSQLSISVFFSTQGVTEPNFIRDSTGNRNVSTASGLKRRFIRPGADSVAVRVTRGLGQILNRNASSSIVPDIYLRGVDRPAYDTATTVDGTSYNKVTYPVMGEVGLPRGTDGKLRVGLDIYLYPLEGGQ
jgi:hypothetical protein